MHLVQRLLSLRETRVPGRRKHHVPRSGWPDALTDVVLHSPQSLIPSSGSTTSPGPDGPTPALTWCSIPRNPLFLRPEAPRLSGQRRRRRTGRGASLPASPYSFVRKHHVPRSGWADALTDVVLYPPQTLVPSSGSTTSPGPDGPTPALTWCSIPRKPLFFRPEAPRPQVRMDRRRH